MDLKPEHKALLRKASTTGRPYVYAGSESYALLLELQKAELITMWPGDLPRRRYYAITKAGQATLEKMM